MSFSSDVKQELSRIELSDSAQKYADLYGMLLFASRFSSREIIFKTENRFAAARFEGLMMELFSPILEKQNDLSPKAKSSGLYKISVVLTEDCKRIFEHFGHSSRNINLRVNRANLESDELFVPFLRGAFLSCGSVTDPEKGYHLELMVRYKILAENLMHLIGEIEVFSVNPKVTPRKGSYLVYIKGSDNICDFLGFIGAGNSVLKVIGVSAYKDMINNLNRRQNSELSNIRKLADASARQVRAIEKIKRQNAFDDLPSELRDIAQLRVDNPEMSLSELSRELGISRGGANHRIERILKIAENLPPND